MGKDGDMGIEDRGAQAEKEMEVDKAKETEVTEEEMEAEKGAEEKGDGDVKMTE